jgi:hypothetical protein
MNDIRKCPECNALIAVNGDASGACPSCGARMDAGPSSPRTARHCINCKAELRGGAVVCKQCGTDQESGKRVFNPDARKRRKKEGEDGATGSEGMPFAVKAVLAAALLVLAAGVWWFSLGRSPSRPNSLPKPPPPVPVERAPMEAPPPAPPPQTSRVERATTPLETALQRYEEQIRRAQFDAAEETRRHIERAFAGKTAATSFWQQVFAPAEPVSLTLAYVCPVCRDGKCPVCQGQPSCSSCKGAGTCSACKGHSRRTVACSSCVCTNCLGNARCPECRGEGTTLCANCNGTGSTDAPRLVACTACGGSGQRPGLRTGDGHMGIRCLTCRGSGKIAQRVRAECPNCRATTRMTCRACSGTARCATCSGKGRLPRCEICAGTGQTTVACRTCKGGGKCPTCGGAGVCKRCSGTGRCYLCDGRNLITETELCLSSAWLKQKPGFVLFDTAAKQAAQTGTNGHHEVRQNGRTLVFDVARGQLLWISTTANFDGVQTALAPRE